MYSRFMDTKLDAWEILQAEVQLGDFPPCRQEAEPVAIDD